MLARLLPYLKYWKPAVTTLAVIVTLWTCHEVKQSWIREGELRERNAHIEQALKSLTKHADSLLKVEKQGDSLIKVRTVTLTKTRVAYKVLHDTLYSSDTVEIPAIVQLADSALVAADSVIAAQNVQIVTLKAGISVRDSMLTNLHAQLKIALDNKPSRFAKVVTAGKYVAAGWVAHEGYQALTAKR